VKYIYTFLFLYTLIGCSKLDEPIFYPCKDGKCDSVFYVDVPYGSYLDNNGYWRVPYQGFKYFTVKGKLDELHEKYVINGVPLVETIFDSNYWVWINNLSFTIPVYSVLSWFTDEEFNNPIPVGEYTIWRDQEENLGYQMRTILWN